MKTRYKIITIAVSISFAIYLALPQIGIAFWQWYNPRGLFGI